MTNLYLHCVICSRKQANGLISGAAWGRFELPPGPEIEHPALSGRTVRACPTCVGNPDWQERALDLLGLGPTRLSESA